MPCPPEVLKRADEIVDQMLAARKDEIKANYLANKYDIENPLAAPNNAPFSDSPPAQIHSQPKRDLFG
jgi:hypothetical protein